MRTSKLLGAVVFSVVAAAGCKEKAKDAPAPTPAPTGDTGKKEPAGSGSGSAAAPVAVDAPAPVAVDAAGPAAVDGKTPMPTVLTEFTDQPNPEETHAQAVLEPWANVAEYCATTANPAGCAAATEAQVKPKLSEKTTENQVIFLIAETDAAGATDYSIAVDESTGPDGSKVEGDQLYVAPHIAHRDAKQVLEFSRFEYTEGKNKQVVDFTWKDGDKEKLAEVQIWDHTVVWFSPDGTMP
jgi:hypothetical protein